VRGQLDREDLELRKPPKNASRTVMIDQLMYAGGGDRQTRDDYEAMSDEELRNTWNFQLGHLME